MSQVIVRPSTGDNPGLHIYPVHKHKSAIASDGRTLRLGSQDLIRLAGYAADHNFVVKGFAVADAFLSPLDLDEQSSASAAMIEILSRYGDGELNAAMDDDFDGLYVTGVELISPSKGLRISVRRQGYVETTIIEDAERLLNSAWRELHLS